VPADTSQRAVVMSFTEAVDRRHVLVRLLRRLPAVQREVLVFRYMLDASVADTAAALDIAEGTVKSAASRGLDQLRMLMSADDTKTRRFAVSIHADDEFNLRLSLMSELDDVTPRAGLADLVITRHRKGRRRRFAGVIGLFVVFVGIGVPVGIASTSGGAPDGAAARSGPVSLRLGSYTLTLPGSTTSATPRPPPCARGPGRFRRTSGRRVRRLCPHVLHAAGEPGAGRPGRAARCQGGHRRPLPRLARTVRLRALR